MSDFDVAAFLADCETIYFTLSQAEVWGSAGGGRVRLDEMEDAHRRNLMSWLDARAPGLANKYGYGQAEYFDRLGRAGMGPSDSSELALQADMEAEWDRQFDDPIGWLHDTPLYRRLVELAAGDHVDVALPRPRTRPRPRRRPIPVEA